MDFDYVKELLDSQVIDLGYRLRSSVLSNIWKTDNFSYSSKDHEKQVFLTEKYIKPNLEVLLELLRFIRRKVDENWLEKRRRYFSDSFKSKDSLLYSYPVGACQFIRDDVFAVLKHNAKKTPKLHFLGKFINAGGFLSKFYAIKDSEYFHNMIRIGTLVLDVAGDAIDRGAEKIKIGQESDFNILPILNSEGFSIFEQFAGIAQYYWDAEVYPNVYFPSIAPMFPLIVVGKRSGFELVRTQSLFANNVVKHFLPSFKFLFDSQYSNLVIPENLREKWFGRSYLATESDIERWFWFYWDKDLSQEEKHRRINESFAVAKNIEKKSARS